MSWETDLAMEFKSRNNPPQIGAVLGTVVSVKPFQASILDGQFILDSENAYICNQLLERNTKMKLTGNHTQSGSLSASCGYGSHNSYSANGNINIDGTIELGEVTKPGDFVLVIPSGDNQTFFIIDVVKGVQ